jgi:NTF2 fold immunity protein of polymorphic toxin system component
MKHCICLLMIATLCLSSASLAQNVPKVFECNGGVVADKETAIRIAEAILSPVYGEKAIREQQPYQVTLKDGKWTVDGTATPPGHFGGRFHIVILQSDGRVLEIGYGG